MLIETTTANGVATIVLNRPEKLNALVDTMREDLLEALRACEHDENVRAIVLTGAGRAFCAGGDVEFMNGLRQSEDVETFRKLLDAGREVIVQVVSMEKPVIASINGVAAGAGCNLALACDYRIASDQAKLGETFVRIGLHPDWGGTWLLPRLVGRGRAMELLMSGRMVAAAEALAIGMIDRMVPAAELAAETEKLTLSIADGPPLAIAAIKRALNATERNDLRTQLDLEAEHQLRCFASSDAEEGMNAFFEKRAAAFTGK
ncbi:MAG TPA: enoyl-CoA hydratase [Thermoanaerobaculia bacterium]|nr:enoyl-CoA hydratase [Thermoanaerobaculia bacterium]